MVKSISTRSKGFFSRSYRSYAEGFQRTEDSLSNSQENLHNSDPESHQEESSSIYPAGSQYKEGLKMLWGLGKYEEENDYYQQAQCALWEREKQADEKNSLKQQLGKRGESCSNQPYRQNFENEYALFGNDYQEGNYHSQNAPINLQSDYDNLGPDYEDQNFIYDDEVPYLPHQHLHSQEEQAEEYD